MYKIIYLFFLFLGVLISISSSSWVGMWVGMELNMMMFIPYVLSMKNLMSSESVIKYYLIQVLASSLFIVFFMMNFINMVLLKLMMIFALAMKLGMSPFHFWLPGFMEGLSWMSNALLMTMQKVGPLVLISYLMIQGVHTEFFFLTIMGVVVGGFGGLGQVSLRKLLAYSSISHMGWMMMSLLNGLYIFILYFLVYVMLSLIICFLFNYFQVFFFSDYYFSLMMKNNVLYFFIFMFMSLGGIPPFLGFFVKWLVLQSMMISGMSWLLFFMIPMVLLTLYYYLRLCFMMMMISDPVSSLSSEVSLNFQMFLGFLLNVLGLFICSLMVF